MNPADIPLRDLHLPAEVSWWPLAPGWWVLLLVCLLSLAVLLRLAYRRAKANRARRAALKQVEQARADYAQDGNLVRLATRLSEVLRRTMLAYAPRSEVAGLTGQAWLAWLDKDLDQPLFTRGAGRELLRLPYRDPASEAADVNVDELVGAVRQRLRAKIGEAA
jgi:hypothetical protein